MHPVFGLLMCWLTRRQNRIVFFSHRPDTDIPNGCKNKRVAKHFVPQALSVKHTESVTEFRVKTCFLPTVWCEDVEENKRGSRRVNEPAMSQWVFRICFITLLLILRYSKHFFLFNAATFVILFLPLWSTLLSNVPQCQSHYWCLGILSETTLVDPQKSFIFCPTSKKNPSPPGNITTSLIPRITCSRWPLPFGNWFRPLPVHQMLPLEHSQVKNDLEMQTFDLSNDRCFAHTLPKWSFFSADHFGWLSVIITRQNIYGSGRHRCCCVRHCGRALAVMSNLASMWAESSVSSRVEGNKIAHLIIHTYRWLCIRAIHCHESLLNQCPVNVNVESAPWLLDPTPPVLSPTKLPLPPSMSKRKKLNRNVALPL